MYAYNVFFENLEVFVCLRMLKTKKYIFFSKLSSGEIIFADGSACGNSF
jgi:hypothetical protein